LPGEAQRTRKSFDELEDARKAATEWDALVAKHRAAKSSPDLRMAPTRLNADQLREAETAFTLIANDPQASGRSLTELVRAGLGARTVRSKPLKDIVAEFLALKRDENVETRTYQSLDSATGQFMARSDTLSLEAVRAFVNERGYVEAGESISYSPTTRRNRRTQIGQLVRWAAAEGYLAEDFMERVKAPRIKDEVGDIVTLTPSQARDLLEAAKRIAEGKLFPYVLLATWAGVRPGELESLQPEQIDLDRGVVEVGRARTQSHRFHRLAPIALHWLRQAPDLKKCLPVSATASAGFRALFAGVRGAANLLDGWAGDTLRHTYISYAVPLLGADEVARQAGNSVGVINRHYRSPKGADDVADFWLRGWPAGEFLLKKVGGRNAETWLKSPNAILHGMAPCRVPLEGAEEAINALKKPAPAQKSDRQP
jgi:integrase